MRLLFFSIYGDENDNIGDTWSCFVDGKGGDGKTNEDDCNANGGDGFLSLSPLSHLLFFHSSSILRSLLPCLPPHLVIFPSLPFPPPFQPFRRHSLPPSFSPFPLHLPSLCRRAFVIQLRPLTFARKSFQYEVSVAGPGRRYTLLNVVAARE